MGVMGALRLMGTMGALRLMGTMEALRLMGRLSIRNLVNLESLGSLENLGSFVMRVTIIVVLLLYLREYNLLFYISETGRCRKMPPFCVLV